MTPQTVHQIAQEIRHFRALLTAQEQWAQQQPRTESIKEAFRRITFWRERLKDAERELSALPVAEPTGTSL